MKYTVMIIILLFLVNGCASGLALHSSNTNCHIISGMTIADIEACGLEPQRCAVKENGGSKCWYRIKVNDDSSPGRAGLHLVADFLTLGFWEVPAIVYELGRGYEYPLSVTFDQKGSIVKTE